MAFSGLRWSDASSLALNSSNNRSCALFSGVDAAAGSATGVTGSGAAAGAVAQAASAAMDPQRNALRNRYFIGTPSCRQDERERGAAARPQRPFGQCTSAVYQKKLYSTSTTSPV